MHSALPLQEVSIRDALIILIGYSIDQLIEKVRQGLRYSDVIGAFVDPYWYVSKFRHELCERRPGKPELRGIKLVELMRRFGIQPSGKEGEHNAKWDADNIRYCTNSVNV